MRRSRIERIAERERELAAVHGAYKQDEAPDLGLELVDPGNGLFANLESLRLIAQRSDEFFRHKGTKDLVFDGHSVTFTSNVETETPENNVVRGEFFERRRSSMAVLILPYWNASAADFNGFARFFALCGLPALRLSLPYHDERKPADWAFAKHLVSTNIGRTIASIRQAVLDVRCAVDWLVARGYRRVGVVGVSIGSCVATIAAAHDERIRAIAQLLMASNFAEAVWTGIATEHIRRSFDGFCRLDELRAFWSGISPDSYVERLARNRTSILMMTGAYDPVFRPFLAEQIAEHYSQHGVIYDWVKLGCGHYTLGDAPYRYIAAVKPLLWLRGVLR